MQFYVRILLLISQKGSVIMNFKRFFASLSGIIVCLLIVAMTITSVFAYSTEDDPLITLSYLNEIVIPALKQEFTQLFNTDTENSDTIPDDTEKTDDNTQAPVTSDIDLTGIGTYDLLELKEGQKVLVNSAVEIIVRPGSNVTCVSPFPSQGIADITNGNEILNDQQIPINAYCILPRGNDGRGFLVHSKDAYIMIRGEYTVE